MKGPIPVPARIRFWRFVDTPADGCWEWQGASANHGYSTFNTGCKLVPGHRFSYEMAYGTIPAGMRTECPRGHEWSAFNQVVGSDGRRRCRTCRDARLAKRYSRQKAKGEVANAVSNALKRKGA